MYLAARHCILVHDLKVNRHALLKVVSMSLAFAICYDSWKGLFHIKCIYHFKSHGSQFFATSLECCIFCRLMPRFRKMVLFLIALVTGSGYRFRVASWILGRFWMELNDSSSSTSHRHMGRRLFTFRYLEISRYSKSTRMSWTNNDQYVVRNYSIEINLVLDNFFATVIRHVQSSHWGWVTHICVGKLNIIGSYNGFSPVASFTNMV